MKLKFLIIVELCCLPVIGHSLSLYDRPLDELYKAADAIVLAQVRGVSADCRKSNHCWGYRLSFDIKSTFKKSARADKGVEVCSEIPLEIGVEYIVFLHPYSFQPISGMKKCAMLLPRDGAFERRADGTYRVNSPEGAISVNAHENVYSTNAILEPEFDEKIAELSRQQAKED